MESCFVKISYLYMNFKKKNIIAFIFLIRLNEFILELLRFMSYYFFR